MAGTFRIGGKVLATHNSETDEISLASDTVYPSDKIPIGVGQDWVDVTTSRAHSTEYQNTTGVPIMISVYFTTAFTQRGQLQVSTTPGSGYITIADADGGDYYSATAGTDHYTNISVIIPNNYYYKIVPSGATFTLKGWYELR
jgi:hypothetical protein